MFTAKEKADLLRSYFSAPEGTPDAVKKHILTQLLDALQEEENRESWKKAGRTTEAKAAEKLLKEATKTIPEKAVFHGVAVEEGKTYFIGAPFGVELYSPVDGLPKCADPDGVIKCIKWALVSSVADPEIRELDADEIKSEYSRRKALKKAGVDINGGEPVELCRIDSELGVNGKYFELISDLFPTARISYKGRAGVFFEAENGRAVLLPVRAKKD